MLDVDKNMKLKMPDFYPNLVRTGTISEGSCFLHSVLKGLNKDNYSSMSKSEKLKYNKQLREEISESLSFEKDPLMLRDSPQDVHVIFIPDNPAEPLPSVYFKFGEEHKLPLALLWTHSSNGKSSI